MHNRDYQLRTSAFQTKEYNLSYATAVPQDSSWSIPPDVTYAFAHQFAREFIEDGAILIEKESNPLRDPITKYVANMTVLPKGISQVMKSYHVFTAFEQEWSSEDIKNALKNTYPERLL